MIQDTSTIKIAKLSELNDKKFELTENADNLEFCLSGIKDTSYSLSFITKVGKETLLDFALNTHIDFKPYVDDGDIIFGVDGKYMILSEDIRMDIIRYLPNSFLLHIDFYTSFNEAGVIEIDFKLSQ